MVVAVADDDDDSAADFAEKGEKDNHKIVSICPSSLVLLVRMRRY
jgi:hypothetical protein